jgi:sugar phosphate permease
VSSGQSRDRNVAWGVTWLAYATYYTGRKGFGVVKKSLVTHAGLSEAMLGAIDTVYLTAYALGQFANGLLGDRIGARRLVGYGMLASAACCAAFGSASLGALFLLFFGLNGWAQSTGWPGTTRAMAEWTTTRNRGTVMAFWATCYQAGGIAASFIAGWLLVRYGWRSVFFGPAVILAAVGVLVLLLLKPAPQVEQAAHEPAERRSLRVSAQRAVLKNPVLWFYAASYFFIKFIRYALLFWLPYYLAKQLGYAEDDAAYASTAFEIGGIVGVIVIGTISDRIRRLSRSVLAASWLAALSVLLLLYGRFAATSVAVNVTLLALVGATLFGPDSLISGAAAQDAGGVHAAATATGFVNGVGSLGAMLEGLAVPAITARFGWSALFPVLVALGMCSALSLVPTLRARRPSTSARNPIPG